ncbi:MAG: FAD-dependent oxidoreductase [Lentisphaerae bacterium]|jgi:hypothetical protein|nr:FAD-dependent oxidoreductase [Lentisphaerota bacterium]MBT4815880.1 FAD-dependent oxidoreductase [Lentisphaerota bacterium]MBT5609073.1 FAD-dependent oxidoreductase [Lentisphaerota bacterium]MBT7053832.1 FAD-dependent oxidoreductase [Lentisphaerota bacterium]MBT7842471.1 FAD-dependent oxidoreductase [Lentisphaerota bacterium]
MAHYTLTREIPKTSAYDIVIAGGGPAGTAAAIVAGRLGAKVLLIEATGCLGGMGTSGLVTAFDPMANGEQNLVGGIMLEIVETMYERGQLPPHVTPEFWRRKYHCWTQFRAEGLKQLLDDMTQDAGVEVLLFTTLVDVDADEQSVNGAIINNIEGFHYVPSKTFIDCTGDAVLAHLAGVPCRTNPHFMPGTLCSLHAGVDWDRAAKHSQQALLEQAIGAGHFTQPDRHLPGLTRAGGQLGYLNGGHLFGKNALNARERTEGMILGRKLVREYVDFYRKYMPGCENMELVCTAALMGVRETRRIVGEYELCFADYQARRQFPDQIGVFNKFVDIHVRDCSDEEYARFQHEMSDIGRLKQGECFGIPYGILVPKGWQNLWVAGRCNSSDVMVHGSIRVMPAAAMMGQAAGTAAVQAIQTGQTACALDTERLVFSLRDQGAYLPQGTLCREMTRRDVSQDRGVNNEV